MTLPWPPQHQLKTRADIEEGTLETLSPNHKMYDSEIMNELNSNELEPNSKCEDMRGLQFRPDQGVGGGLVS